MGMGGRRVVGWNKWSISVELGERRIVKSFIWSYVKVESGKGGCVLEGFKCRSKFRFD